MSIKERDDYYARVQRIVGDKLLSKRVAVYGLSYLSKAIELLVNCGLLQFGSMDDESVKTDDMMALVWGINNGGIFENDFFGVLKRHNELEDRWDFAKGDAKEDLILAAGSLTVLRGAYDRAKEKNVPAILGALLEGGTSVINVMFPGDDFLFNRQGIQFIEPLRKIRYFDWIDLNNQMANLAKALLLRGSDWSRPDIYDFLDNGRRAILLAHPTWPWVQRYFSCSKEDIDCLEGIITRAIGRQISASLEYKLDGKNVLIVGLGSLGSIIADHMRFLGANVTGIDCRDVSQYNPVRQLYSTRAVGKPKSIALMIELEERERIREGQSFGGEQAEIPNSIKGAKMFDRLIEKWNPDLVFLTTAHSAESRMADILRKRNIPHIIARCYPRGRWFEITMVDGANGPCFNCFHRQLFTGAVPELTEEQMARYDPNTDPEILKTEPATRVETSRAVDAASRMGAELSLAGEKRSLWMRKLLDESRTFFVGGNYVEKDSENDWAYGVETPGGMAVYGAGDIIGAEGETLRSCLYCGKVHEVLVHRVPEREVNVNE